MPVSGVSGAGNVERMTSFTVMAHDGQMLANEKVDRLLHVALRTSTATDFRVSAKPIAAISHTSVPPQELLGWGRWIPSLRASLLNSSAHFIANEAECHFQLCTLGIDL